MEAEWKPKTKLGKFVHRGEITSIQEALKSRLPLREPEIVDVLVPDLEDEVLEVNMVQRMTDSGRRINFNVLVVVGNRNGLVGISRRKGGEVGATIKKAIDNAKLNLISIRRGCGSWECGCWKPHSIPFKVKGKRSSSEIVLYPAPRGTSLACGEAIKPIMRLAGIKDIWTFTRGKTRTVVNSLYATFDALRKLSEFKVSEKQIEKLKIIEGPVDKE